MWMHALDGWLQFRKGNLFRTPSGHMSPSGGPEFSRRGHNRKRFAPVRNRGLSSTCPKPQRLLSLVHVAVVGLPYCQPGADCRRCQERDCLTTPYRTQTHPSIRLRRDSLLRSGYVKVRPIEIAQGTYNESRRCFIRPSLKPPICTPIL